MKRIIQESTRCSCVAIMWLACTYSFAAQNHTQPAPEGHCYGHDHFKGEYFVVSQSVIPPATDKFHAEIADVYFTFRGERPVLFNGKRAIFSARFYVDVPKVGASFPGEMTLFKGDCPQIAPSLQINGNTILPNARPIQFEANP
jgi:hypothetical protein